MQIRWSIDVSQISFRVFEISNALSNIFNDYFAIRDPLWLTVILQTTWEVKTVVYVKIQTSKM